MLQIKFYNQKGKLFKSAPFPSLELPAAMCEVIHYDPRAIFLINGKQSSQIYPSKDIKKRPVFYRRPDGEKIYFLSIHPKHYPLRAYYSDGTTELI